MTPIPEALPESPPAGLVAVPDVTDLRSTVESLACAGGASVAAILMYGSHVQGSAPDRWSAYDFILVTDAYSPFFTSLVEHGYHDRPAWLLTMLAHVLPPNIVSFDVGHTDRSPAKCSVLSTGQFRRSLGPHAPDHFLRGRVVQKLALVWARGPADQEMVISALRKAREGIVDWVRPYLTGGFSVEDLARRMLQVCYGAEVRPENRGRAAEVFHSQKETLVAIAAESLSAAEGTGRVIREGDRYRWTPAPGRLPWMWYKAYFALSKVRGVLRWGKYLITYQDWANYIQRKVERRAGFKLKLNERERQWPWIFIWPRVFEVLRKSRSAEPPSSADQDLHGQP